MSTSLSKQNSSRYSDWISTQNAHSHIWINFANQKAVVFADATKKISPKIGWLLTRLRKAFKPKIKKYGETKETNPIINGFGMFRTNKMTKDSILMCILTSNRTQDIMGHTFGLWSMKKIALRAGIIMSRCVGRRNFSIKLFQGYTPRFQPISQNTTEI